MQQYAALGLALTLGCVVIAVLSLVSLVVWERWCASHGREALISPSLFRTPSFTAGVTRRPCSSQASRRPVWC